MLNSEFYIIEESGCQW